MEYLSLFNLEAALLLPFYCLLRSPLQPAALAGCWLLGRATPDPPASLSDSRPLSEVFFFAPMVPGLARRPARKPVPVTKPELHLCQMIHLSWLQTFLRTYTHTHVYIYICQTYRSGVWEVKVPSCGMLSPGFDPRDPCPQPEGVGWGHALGGTQQGQPL